MGTTPYKSLRDAVLNGGLREGLRYARYSGRVNECFEEEGTRMTILHLAVASKGSVAVKLALDSGANPDLPDDDGNTPLASAALMGLDDIAEQLLERGADPNVQNHTGDTALHIASVKEDHQTVAALIRHGARQDIPNGRGITGRQVMDFDSLKRILGPRFGEFMDAMGGAGPVS